MSPEPGDGGDDRSREPRAPRSGPDPADRKDQSPDELSAIRFVNVLLRHRKLVTVTPLVVAVLVVVGTVLLPPTYTVTVSFTPETEGAQASRFSGLASQFGIDVPAGQAGQSPQFYAYLLRTRELHRATVVTEYDLSTTARQDSGTGQSRDLVSFLGHEGEPRPVAVAKAVRELRELFSVSANPETGVIELSVSTHSPDLSQQVAERMVDLVSEFNLERRKSQAAAKRDFIEEQLGQARADLRAAEDSLERFLEQNRQYENSPTLRFERQRLQRRVDLRQQVYNSLAQSFQQSKIDEVRNTPVITVVEPPQRPARPDPSGLPLKVVLGLLVGGGVAVFWAFSREMLASSRRTDPDDYEEYARLKEESLRELRSVFQKIRSAFG